MDTIKDWNLRCMSHNKREISKKHAKPIKTKTSEKITYEDVKMKKVALNVPLGLENGIVKRWRPQRSPETEIFLSHHFHDQVEFESYVSFVTTNNVTVRTFRLKWLRNRFIIWKDHLFFWYDEDDQGVTIMKIFKIEYDLERLAAANKSGKEDKDCIKLTKVKFSSNCPLPKIRLISSIKTFGDTIWVMRDAGHKTIFVFHANAQDMTATYLIKYTTLDGNELDISGWGEDEDDTVTSDMENRYALGSESDLPYSHPNTLSYLDEIPPHLQGHVQCLEDDSMEEEDDNEVPSQEESEMEEDMEEEDEEEEEDDDDEGQESDVGSQPPQGLGSKEEPQDSEEDEDDEEDLPEIDEEAREFFAQRNDPGSCKIYPFNNYAITKCLNVLYVWNPSTADVVAKLECPEISTVHFIKYFRGFLFVAFDEQMMLWRKNGEKWESSTCSWKNTKRNFSFDHSNPFASLANMKAFFDQPSYWKDFRDWTFQLPWDVKKTLIAGFQKNSSKECKLAQLPKPIFKTILEYASSPLFVLDSMDTKKRSPSEVQAIQKKHRW